MSNTTLSEKEKIQLMCNNAQADYTNQQQDAYKRCWDSAKCLEAASVYNAQISMYNMSTWEDIKQEYLTCANKPGGYLDYWNKNCKTELKCTKFVSILPGLNEVKECDKDLTNCSCAEVNVPYCGPQGEEEWMNKNCPEYVSKKNQLNGPNTDPITVSNLVCQDCPTVEEVSGIVDSNIHVNQLNNCVAKIGGKTYSDTNSDQINVNPNQVVDSSGHISGTTITSAPTLVPKSTKLKYELAGGGLIFYISCCCFCLFLAIIYYSLVDSKSQSSIGDSSSSSDQLNINKSNLF